MGAFVASGPSIVLGRPRRCCVKRSCKVATVMQAWRPDSWRSCEGVESAQSLTNVAKYPPLVHAGEVERLRAKLSKVQAGEAFLLKAGDREEDFALTQGENTESTFRLLVAQVIIIAYFSGLPVVKVGHVGGDFERTGPYGVKSDDEAQVNKSYFQASASLNLLRAVAKSTTSMLDWTAFVEKVAGDRYKAFLEQIEDSLGFVQAAGLDVYNEDFREPEFYSAHDLNLIPYEEALSRQDEGDKWYSTAAHMHWISMRRMTEAHSTYLSGVRNPVSIRVDSDTDLDKLVQIIKKINPANETGKITLSISFGASHIWSKFPKVVRKVEEASLSVLWANDPMRKNVLQTDNGCLSCPVELILTEVASFFAICVQMGIVPGGIYLDMTGKDISECIGGIGSIKDEDVLCEAGPNMSPRLNSEQGLQVAFEVGRLLRQVKKPGQRLRREASF
mmetsp:Transcript_11598/g.35439  ORF Transcript_11598/g.35439 Transcript_11598/m.35439 type:complete len:447 (+) Transcript_11598:175-1515(+)